MSRPNHEGQHSKGTCCEAPSQARSQGAHLGRHIQKRCHTHLCVWSHMDGSLYVSILDKFLLPFLMETFPDGDYRFMQDNNLKHTSRVAKDLYAQKGIHWWKTPASSADINPIQRVWRELKHFIARVDKPLSKKELMERIFLFLCSTYFDHTFKVLPLIVAKEGAITVE